MRLPVRVRIGNRDWGMARSSIPHSRFPIPTLVSLALALATSACARPRDIERPVPGAVEITVTDSVRYVVDAAVRAITDEAVGVVLADADRGLVESAWVELDAIRTPLPIDLESYTGLERTVRFTFHVRPTFGGSTVAAAATYQPSPVGGRATERMVPVGHPARAVLDRMLTRIREYVDAARRAREERGTAPAPRR